jgi:hypothetical protein
MPSYQFPVAAAQIALFVRATGGTDVTTRNGAGEEVLAGYVTARVGQQTGERS